MSKSSEPSRTFVDGPVTEAKKIHKTAGQSFSSCHNHIRCSSEHFKCDKMLQLMIRAGTIHRCLRSMQEKLATDLGRRAV